ncbi:hypothetical protein DERP_014960 [Dermatophagoides pteronyssinus]|uniref:Uncharacterized protein LOC113795420 n=2 Tax=Dermatophagoides pteronyssinus TaxID=6956 RepID=A0A6P6Y7W8_DERPT|nr:uncharacterized protein LOC113795420 [Dermatophagoides pteronyssinus]KAH9421685.1 hypothetical protein DERP_014960 [Dermatophagoides pteronyssinus]
MEIASINNNFINEDFNGQQTLPKNQKKTHEITFKKSSSIRYSNAKLFHDNYLIINAIGALHTKLGDEIISGKLFFSIEKFKFSPATKSSIRTLMKESKSGQAFVREIKVLVSLLISDLNQIFVLPPPDSVLRETSLKLNFEYPQLQKIYEKEKMEKYFNDVLFTKCIQKKLRNKFNVVERRLREAISTEEDKIEYLNRKKTLKQKSN